MRPPRKGGGGKKRAGGGAGGGGPKSRRPNPKQPRGRKQGPRKSAADRSDYFVQPGRRGTFVVLRRPIGNRATAKVCGEMPSKVHARMLVESLEAAESVVKDLFMEATDDGIEALEAVLLACREEVMRTGPAVVVQQDRPAELDVDAPDGADPMSE